MYCEECQKRPATVHFTQVINGNKTESHLCEQCAAQKGTFVFNIENQFSIPSLLGNLFASYTVPTMQALKPAKSCPLCGTDFNAIRKTGKLGCSECYAVFEEEMEPTLRRVHGNSQHIGKVPARGGEKVMVKKQLDALKTKLQQAVLQENYEQAAEIRDAIKQWEKKMD